jgi:hypothetical protein
MITRLPLAAALLLLAPVAAQAATGQAANRFTIPLSYQEARAWYEAHHAGVLEASNCRIVERQEDDKLLVETRTRLGVCRYVVRTSREERTTDDGLAQTVYRLRYVRNVRGRIVAQNCTTTYTDAGERTEVDVKLTATVSGRFVPSFLVRRDLTNSLAGAERFILENVKPAEVAVAKE